jgi:hypothetical protein
MIKGLYRRWPKLGKVFFGKDPEVMDVDGLRKEVYSNRLMFLVWLVVAILAVFGVMQMRAEINSCWNGELLQECFDALDGVRFGFDRSVLNLSLGEALNGSGVNSS